jgi:hypothetical protein
MTRREAVRHVAGLGLGVAAALKGAGGDSRLLAQNPAIPIATPPSGDPRFPMVPSWKAEFRQLAPNVFAFIQAGGPGIVAQGVSNAGVIVGADHVMVIDATGAPFHAKALIAAATKAAPGKSIRRLINTHHHGDHVNGNQFFGPIEILSQTYCRQEVLKAVPGTPTKWDKREGWADGTEDRKLVPPTTTIDGTWSTTTATWPSKCSSWDPPIPTAT